MIREEAPPVKALVQYAVALESAYTVTARLERPWPADGDFRNFKIGYDALRGYSTSELQHDLKDLARKLPELKALRMEFVRATAPALKHLKDGKLRRALAYWDHADQAFNRYAVAVDKLTVSQALVQSHYQVLIESLGLWSLPEDASLSPGLSNATALLADRRDLVFVDDGAAALALYINAAESLLVYADLLKEQHNFKTFNPQWMEQLAKRQEELFEQLQVAEMLAAVLTSKI